MEHVFKAAHRFVLFFASVFFWQNICIRNQCFVYDTLSIISNDTVFKMRRKRLPVQNNLFFIRQNKNIAFLKIKSKHFYLKQT